jgi:DNA-binding HxlR family transcriptional regulator
MGRACGGFGAIDLSAHTHFSTGYNSITNYHAHDHVRFTQSRARKISKPTLSEHLKHLLERKLIIRKVEEAQNVSYSPNPKRVPSTIPADDFEILDFLQKFGTKMPKKSKEIMDRAAIQDLDDMILLNLLELKAIIDYELNIREQYKSGQSNAEFWQFLGNPAYRRIEMMIVDECKEDEGYKKILFKKIDEIISEIKGRYE